MSMSMVDISKSTEAWYDWEEARYVIEKDLAGTLRATGRARKAAMGEGSDDILRAMTSKPAPKPWTLTDKPGPQVAQGGRGRLYGTAAAGAGVIGGGALLAGRAFKSNRKAAATAARSARKRRILIGGGAGAAGLYGAGAVAAHRRHD